MNFTIAEVPIWVSILFIASFGFLPFLIARAVKKSLQESNNAEVALKIHNRTLIFYLFFFLIVSVTSLAGFYAINTLPPRILIFTALPLFAFYIIVLQKMNWFNEALEKGDIAHLVDVHIFRFVGIFFLINYYYDALPKDFAYVGGIGDILTAFLALIFVLFIKKKKYAIVYLWVFNTIGLIDILLVLGSAIVITQSSIANGEVGIIQFAMFPFSWIPAAAPATIIFLHILIYKKLLKTNKT